MNQDERDTQDTAEEQDARDEYAAPTLERLGSFEELTRFGGATHLDTEGSS